MTVAMQHSNAIWKSPTATKLFFGNSTNLLGYSAEIQDKNLLTIFEFGSQMRVLYEKAVNPSTEKIYHRFAIDAKRMQRVGEFEEVAWEPKIRITLEEQFIYPLPVNARCNFSEIKVVIEVGEQALENSYLNRPMRDLSHFSMGRSNCENFPRNDHAPDNEHISMLVNAMDVLKTRILDELFGKGAGSEDLARVVREASVIHSMEKLVRSISIAASKNLQDKKRN